MSMSNDMVWDSKGMMKYVETIQRQFNRMFVDSVAVTGLSLGLDLKRSGTELTRSKTDGSWDRIAGQMLLNFSGSRHPVFRCTSALERGQLRSKTSGKKSIHFNDVTETLSCFSKRSSPSISSVCTDQ